MQPDHEFARAEYEPLEEQCSHCGRVLGPDSFEDGLRCKFCQEAADGSALASSKPLESNPLAEKEGFEPSFSSKSHGNRLGFPSDRLEHGFGGAA